MFVDYLIGDASKYISFSACVACENQRKFGVRVGLVVKEKRTRSSKDLKQGEIVNINNFKFI